MLQYLTPDVTLTLLKVQQGSMVHIVGEFRGPITIHVGCLIAFRQIFMRSLPDMQRNQSKVPSTLALLFHT
jgi:hypothetical protein